MHPFAQRNTDGCHIKILNYKKFKMQNQKHTNKIFQHFQLSVAIHVVLFELLKMCMPYKNNNTDIQVTTEFRNPLVIAISSRWL